MSRTGSRRKNWLGSYSGISCWEIAGNAAVHECKDAIADRLSYVDLFSLNLTEGKRITGETEPLRVVDVLRQMHADNVILRMGAKGRAGSQGRRSLGDSSGACQCGGRDRRRQFPLRAASWSAIVSPRAISPTLRAALFPVVHH